MLHPAELSLYYRYRFQIAGTETILPTVPVHFYAKIKLVRLYQFLLHVYCSPSLIS